LHKEGGYEVGPGNGTINSAQDDAIDGTLNTVVDMAGNGILEAATDTAGHRGADIEMEGDWDKWGRSMATKNSVSRV